jgi:hypothetical protein
MISYLQNIARNMMTIFNTMINIFRYYCTNIDYYDPELNDGFYTHDLIAYLSYMDGYAQKKKNDAPFRSKKNNSIDIYKTIKPKEYEYTLITPENLPRNLYTIEPTTSYKLDKSINDLPCNLHTINPTTKYNFNQPIGDLPSNLYTIKPTTKYNFDKPISELPSNLHELNLGEQSMPEENDQSTMNTDRLELKNQIKDQVQEYMKSLSNDKSQDLKTLLKSMLEEYLGSGDNDDNVIRKDLQEYLTSEKGYTDDQAKEVIEESLKSPEKAEIIIKEALQQTFNNLSKQEDVFNDMITKKVDGYLKLQGETRSVTEQSEIECYFPPLSKEEADNIVKESYNSSS